MDNKKNTYTNHINTFFYKGYSTCTNVAMAPFASWSVPDTPNTSGRPRINAADVILKLFLAVPVLIPLTVATSAIGLIGVGTLGVGHLASLGVATVLDGNEENEDTEKNTPEKRPF